MTSRKVASLDRQSETAWAAWFLHRQTLQGSKQEPQIAGVAQYELLDHVPFGVHTGEGVPDTPDLMASTPSESDLPVGVGVVDRGSVFLPPARTPCPAKNLAERLNPLDEAGRPATYFKRVPVAGHFLVFGFRYSDSKVCAQDEPQLWIKVSKSSAVCVGLILNADETDPYLMEGAPLLIGHKATFKDKTSVIALCSVTRLFLGPQLGTFTKTIDAEADTAETRETAQLDAVVEPEAPAISTKKVKAESKSKKKSAKKGKAAPKSKKKSSKKSK